MQPRAKRPTAPGAIDFERLEKSIAALAMQYQQASPFPHIALDHFLIPHIAEQAYETFPRLSAMSSLGDYRHRKAQDPLLHKFDPIFSEIILGELHSERFLTFLSALTGIPGLIADPQLHAAGLAQGGDGSFLNVHIDHSSHPVQPWYRRVNLLLYLNQQWNESKGGHLELWDDKMKNLSAILPVFNRAVLFTASPISWHGYRKVKTSDGDTRKSINLNYFTKESPKGKPYSHVASFRARPGELKNRWLYPVDNFVRGLYGALSRRK